MSVEEGEGPAGGVRAPRFETIEQALDWGLGILYNLDNQGRRPNATSGRHISVALPSAPPSGAGSSIPSPSTPQSLSR